MERNTAESFMEGEIQPNASLAVTVDQFTAEIKEYYESYGSSVPACGITPEQEWMRDSRGPVFLDVSVVAEAFLHRERRRIDEAGGFSLGGNRYEASSALSKRGMKRGSRYVIL